jgi:hypothetical protein
MTPGDDAGERRAASREGVVFVAVLMALTVGALWLASL